MRLMHFGNNCLSNALRRFFPPLLFFTLGTLFSDHVHNLSKYVNQNKNEQSLQVLILSGVNNRNRRDACRETWLKLTQSTRHHFAIGTKGLSAGEKSLLDLESNQYNDILLLPSVNDSYSSLTEKLIESFKVIHSRAKYTLKVDDDSFVRLDLLETQLNSLMDGKLVYWGFFSAAAPVFKSGVWAESTWFLCDKYLPYAVGGGYILSRDLVDYIVHNVHLLQQYANEDISVGTWLSPLKIRRIHDTRFDTWWKSRGCSDSFFITHKQTPKKMRQYAKNLRQNGRMCTQESFEHGYSYNWTALPSKCCLQKPIDFSIDIS